MMKCGPGQEVGEGRCGKRGRGGLWDVGCGGVHAG